MKISISLNTRIHDKTSSQILCFISSPPRCASPAFDERSLARLKVEDEEKGLWVWKTKKTKRKGTPKGKRRGRKKRKEQRECYFLTRKMTGAQWPQARAGTPPRPPWEKPFVWKAMAKLAEPGREVGCWGTESECVQRPDGGQHEVWVPHRLLHQDWHPLHPPPPPDMSRFQRGCESYRRGRETSERPPWTPWWRAL